MVIWFIPSITIFTFLKYYTVPIGPTTVVSNRILCTILDRYWKQDRQGCVTSGTFNSSDVHKVHRQVYEQWHFHCCCFCIRTQEIGFCFFAPCCHIKEVFFVRIKLAYSQSKYRSASIFPECCFVTASIVKSVIYEIKHLALFVIVCFLSSTHRCLFHHHPVVRLEGNSHHAGQLLAPVHPEIPAQTLLTSQLLQADLLELRQSSKSYEQKDVLLGCFYLFFVVWVTQAICTVFVSLDTALKAARMSRTILDVFFHKESSHLCHLQSHQSYAVELGS